MKKLALPILCIIFLFAAGCSEKIVRTYQAPTANEELLKNCTPMIIRDFDMYGLNLTYLGRIRFEGGSLYCSESEVMSYLRREACLLQGNVIEIIDEAYPDFYRSKEGDELSSLIFRTKKRLTVSWEEKPKLDWADFKVTLPESDTMPYIFVSNLRVGSGVNVWTGKYNDFQAYGIFYSDVSKVKESFKTEENLAHIQRLYDLTQVYAKKMEKVLEEERIKAGYRGEVQKIVEKHLENLVNQQKWYISQTNYGQNKSAQKQWDEQIAIEMRKYGIK